MKSYTDIEQSKVLEDILPLDSHDMYYEGKNGDLDSEFNLFIGQDISILKNLFSYRFGYTIPAWSLAALLQIIPKDIEGLNRLRIDIDNVDFSIWYDDLKGYGVNDKLPDITLKEPIDACYEMVLKLHESKLL